MLSHTSRGSVRGAALASEDWRRRKLHGDLVTPRFTESEVTAMLREYVRLRLTPSAFARRFGMGLASAKCMLQGITYPQVPRPDGFAYPWPKIASGLSPSKVAEGLALVKKHRWTANKLAAHLRIEVGLARQIIVGDVYSDVPRPW